MTRAGAVLVQGCQRPQARLVTRGKALEADYTRTMVDALIAIGWLACHHPDSRKLVGKPGLPDIIAARAGRLVFIEMKLRNGRRSNAQDYWRVQLTQAGAEYFYCIAPDDMDEVLKAMGAKK